MIRLEKQMFNGKLITKIQTAILRQGKINYVFSQNAQHEFS